MPHTAAYLPLKGFTYKACKTSLTRSQSLARLFCSPQWKKTVRTIVYRVGVAAASSVLGMMAANPGQAMEVTIQPPLPRLGETVAITAKPEGSTLVNPVVMIGTKNYPTFAIGGNRFRALVPTTPLDQPGRRVVQVSAPNEKTRNLAFFIKNRSFPVQSIWLPPSKSSLQGTDYEFDRVDAFKQLVSPQRLWSGPFRKPTRGPVSTPYGVRRYYNGVFANDYYHRGIDYAAAQGTAVIAPANGKIALVGREAQGFEIHGNTIGVDHGQGVSSIMIHLDQIYVQEGDSVQAGQVIGTVGSTGISTGPHLHWGLYVQGQAVDPAPWLSQGFE